MDSENPKQKKETTTPDDRILLWCSYCGQKYRLRKELAGKTGTCDECNNDFLIPNVSQTKPESKAAISFPCKHCNKKLLKPEKLAGTEITCHECNKKNIVPENLEEDDSPIDLLEPYLVAETTRTDIKIAIPEESTEDNKILFWCNCCGQKYRLPRHLDGKSGVCSKCKNFLFIPHVSQTKPELKKTISFPCEHCGKKQLKAQELAGTETTCYHCSEKYIIPTKSKKTFIQIVNPISLLEPFLVAETTRTDLPIPEDKILFWCSHCGQKYRLPRNLDGKAGICTKCQSYLFIPHVSQSKPQFERSVVFPCKYCGQRLRKARKLAGTEVKCKKCGKKVIIPEKSKISALPPKGASSEERILFWCSYCSQKYRLPKHLAGKTGNCDKCQKHFVIPSVSQIKPELKKTIIFPCEDCGKTLWEAEDLIGVEVQCSRCGEGNIVPEKSKKALVEKLASKNIPDHYIAPKSMPGDPVQTGLSSEEKAIVKAEVKTTLQAQRSSLKKDITEDPIISNAKAAAAASIKKSITSESQVITSRKTQIIITDNPPTIHKMKNYFHEKAEKYFIFALFIVVIDYIIDMREAGHRPSKAFVLICTFAIAAIILLGSWNFAVAESPEKENNTCRYNVMCTKCAHHEIRRFNNINKQRCRKCGKAIGLTYHCNKCKKNFAYSEPKKECKIKDSDIKKLKGENPKITDMKMLFSDSSVPKCPFCHSDDIRYVVPKRSPSKRR